MLPKSAVKQPITIYHEFRDGKVYIMATAEIENLYLKGQKIIDIP